MKSTFFAAMLVLSSAAASAQTPDYASAVRGSWNRVKGLLTASAEAMPEANYSFKPSPDVRTFGELIGHLVNDHYLFCAPLKGEANPQANVDFEKKTAKAELTKALADSIAYCDAVYTAAKDEPKLLQPLPNRRDTPFGSLLMNVTHDSEHYGNLVTYLRMKGIVPPSTRPSR